MPLKKPHSLKICILFILFMGFSRQEYWSGLPYSSGPHSVSPLHHAHPRWAHRAWLSFIELDKVGLWRKWSTWRIDAFELWCWRRLLRVPWTARRSNQSILKEISPGITLEGMMLKLKPQYFGHLMQRVDSLEDSDAGRDWGQEEKGTTEDEMAGWHHWLDRRESEWTPGVGDGQGGLVCCDSWGRKELDTTEQLNWTEWYARS